MILASVLTISLFFFIPDRISTGTLQLADPLSQLLTGHFPLSHHAIPSIPRTATTLCVRCTLRTLQWDVDARSKRVKSIGEIGFLAGAGFFEFFAFLWNAMHQRP